VLATISDKKFGVTSGGSSLIDHYEPDIITAQDYYPFGMLSREALPNSNVPYKFGFNGKMNDNDVKGGFGLQQDYGMRVYDNRVGRFLSVDPLTGTYPELTPYQFASNRPIDGIDQDGLEYSPASSNGGNPRDATAVQTGINPDAVMKRMMDRNKSQTSVPPLNTGGNATLSQGSMPGTWSANESEGLKNRFDYNKELYDRARLDPVGFGVPFTTFNASNEFLKGVSNHAYGAYEGIEDRNGWKVAKNSLLLFLDIAPLIKIPGVSVEASISIKSSEEAVSAPMTFIRTIKKGEKIDDIVNEAKGLTWQTGNEHALVKLANGQRALVSGGPGGIIFKKSEVELLYGHTHPTSAPPSHADGTSLFEFGQTRQYVFHGGNVSLVRPKKP
jgi:RHS repeat-associated protein